MLRTTAKCTVYGKLILDLNPDSRGAMTLTEYELERQERIRLNKAQMAAMGLAETVKEMEKTKDVHTIRANRPAKPPIRRVIAKSKNNNFVRRSVRNTGREAPNYTSNFPNIDPEPRQRSHPPRRVTKSGKAKNGKYEKGGWNESKGEACPTAAKAAVAAAEAFIDEIEENGGHAFLKIMTSSQVSGGFWCNAPRGLNYYIEDVKSTIYLRLPDSEISPTEDYRDDDGSWHVIWLPRGKGGIGFSGGWRSFSIDLDLYPSDVCVFEVVESQKPGALADTLIVHIFRAFDYDENAPLNYMVQVPAASGEVEEDEEDEGVAAAAAPDGSIPEFTPSGDSYQGGEIAGEESEVEATEANNGVGGEEEEEHASGADYNLENGIGRAQAGVDEECAPAEEDTTQDTEAEMLEGSLLRRKQMEQRRMCQKAGKKKTTPSKSPVAAAQKRKRQTTVSELEEPVVQKRSKSGGISQGKQETNPQKTTKATTTKSGKSKAKKPRSGSTSRKSIQQPAHVEKENAVIDNAGDEDQEEEEEAYFVERIMGVRTEADGTRRYLIKWWGYSDKDNTWEPAEMLDNAPETYRRAPGVKL